MLLVPSYPSLWRTRLRLGQAVFVALLALVWWGWVPPLAGAVPSTCVRQTNAAWAGVEWTSTPIDPATVRQLTRRADAAQLRYLFPFATYRKPDGRWSSEAPFAREFVRTFRATDPRTALLAWVGLPSQWTDFADPQTCVELSASLAALVRDAGFDGVHIDAEPMADGDRGYLAFLAELRGALGPSALLSVAVLPWGTPIETALPASSGYRWSGAYYRNGLAGLCAALASPSTEGAPVAGVSLYALWEMREADWYLWARWQR